MQISLIDGGGSFWVQLQVQIWKHEEEEEGGNQDGVHVNDTFPLSVCIRNLSGRYFAGIKPCVNYDRDSN